MWQDLPFTLGPFHIAGQTIKDCYTHCDLVAYDLVVLYGIESSMCVVRHVCDQIVLCIMGLTPPWQ